MRPEECSPRQRADAVQDLAQGWRDAGLAGGDMVLVHSSGGRTLRRLVQMGCGADPDIVIDSLLSAVGEAGTVLFPLFNFDFTTGVPFRFHETPSQMGIITETARKRPGAVRTMHPIYSFAVLGRRAPEFEGLDNYSGYGGDSPFGVLHRANGKIAVIDLPDQNSMTFYHYVEEQEAVPYRYFKEFTGEYHDPAGAVSNRTYALYVRDIENRVRTDVDPMGELLWERGLYSGDRPKTGSGMRVIEAARLFDTTVEVIRGGRAEGLLYSIGD